MQHVRITARALAAAAVVAGSLGACARDTGTSPAASTMVDARQAAASQGVGGTERQLAQLKAALEPIKQFGAAREAGYNAQITGCLEMPPMGGMGFHYGNPTLINDGKVDPLHPELLLYEPEKNGQMRFVAVEFIVPYGLWTDPNPPELFGQTFKRNDAFGIWALHAWIGAHNPSGVFADWNPTVHCPA
jgi:hypothetical protein